MKKLPKFITRLITTCVERTIQICFDLSLQDKHISLSTTSDLYKDGLHEYSTRVLELLKQDEVI